MRHFLETIADLPRVCTICFAGPESELADLVDVPVTTDALGMCWCEKHKMHGAIINYGKRNSWKEADCYNMIIGEGIRCYILCAIFCSDEQAYIAEGTFEYLETEQPA